MLGLAAVASVLSACGALGGAAPTAVAPTSAPASAVPATSAPPSPTRPQAAATAPPVPAAKPAATDAPAASATTVYVGNTDGEGVYIRKTPVMADRAKAYPDGTALTVVGDDVDGDDHHWKHIKTPDGLEGYVPSIYTVETRP